MRSARWGVLYGKEEYTEGDGGVRNEKEKGPIQAGECWWDWEVLIPSEEHREGGKEFGISLRSRNPGSREPMVLEECYPRGGARRRGGGG